MQLHVTIRNSQGVIQLAQDTNDTQARRMMEQALQREHIFSVRHRKTTEAPSIEPKQHDEAVAAASAIAETDREDIYAAGYAAMVDKLAEALGLEIGTDDVACLEAITK